VEVGRLRAEVEVAYTLAEVAFGPWQENTLLEAAFPEDKAYAA